MRSVCTMHVRDVARLSVVRCVRDVCAHTNILSVHTQICAVCAQCVSEMCARYCEPVCCAVCCAMCVHAQIYCVCAHKYARCMREVCARWL